MFEPPSNPVGAASFRPIPWFAWECREAALRVDDHILRTIVYVGASRDGGPFHPYGTGFVTALLGEREFGWQSVVTAKHVIEDIDGNIVHLRVNSRQGDAVLIPTQKTAWWFHPDPRIDVAVCPTTLLHEQFDVAHFPLRGPDPGQNSALTDEMIERYHIGVGDDVYVPGMFIARLGQQKNLPIIRIGTIAAMPVEPIETKYGIYDAFLVEVRSIDGLSGSPVCINLVGRTIPLSAPPRPLPHPGEPQFRFFLAGMILGYNEVYNPRDTIEIRERLAESVTRATVPLNTGIAVVLPVWRILEVMEQPKLTEARQEWLQRPNRDKGRGFVPTSAAPLGVPETNPASDENPDHREDFNRLVSAASKPKPKDDRT